METTHFRSIFDMLRPVTFGGEAAPLSAVALISNSSNPFFLFHSFNHSSFFNHHIYEVFIIAFNLYKHKMDVGNLNATDHRNNKNKPKMSVCNAAISQFSIETYFIWFSTLIFITEVIVGECFSCKFCDITSTRLSLFTFLCTHCETII